MEFAQQMVSDVVARCRFHHVEVSESLVAFVLQAIVHQTRKSHSIVFEKPLEPSQQQFLIDKALVFLLDKPNVSLETIRMQIEFDFLYAKLEEELRQQQETKASSVNHLVRTIATLVPNKPGDFETLTTIYRQMFTLLMLHATPPPSLVENADKPSSSSGSNSSTIHNHNHGKLAQQELRAIEKEVVAALESVFPRIGLKSFVTLSVDDKRNQLEELARIVMGIRLFNKEIGKGGAGLQFCDVSKLQQLCETTLQNLSVEITSINQICTYYTEVLLHVHHFEKPLVGNNRNQLLETWQLELRNRRQFLSYLQSVQEDLQVSKDKLAEVSIVFQSDMTALKSLVGGRTSLPKSQVYPLFEAVSRSWDQLVNELELIQIRVKCFKQLMLFKEDIQLSLTSDSEFVKEAHRAGAIPSDELFENLPSFSAEKKLHDEHHGEAKVSTRETNQLESKDDQEIEEEDIRLGGDDTLLAAEEEGSNFPIRMPVESTPEFLQLPLEYQGYCPWTIVERNGLLLPGDPSLGVVQYRNAFHVFVNERALGEFMIHPRRYVLGILKLARQKPELIYLLRLQEHFPQMELTHLLQMCASIQNSNGNGGKLHPLLAPVAQAKVDASTSTPVHFYEKNIDHNYDWNEWELRRKAVKIANLRNCTTVSTQTALSHFRSEMETQVYLSVENSSQTDQHKGTNPPRVVTYFAGLRGSSDQAGSEAKAEAKSPSKSKAHKAVDKETPENDVKNSKHKHDQPQQESQDQDGAANLTFSLPTVVSYTFEL